MIHRPGRDSWLSDGASVADPIESLLDKLRKIAALHAGATSEGEAAAAARAMERVQQQLANAQEAAPPKTAKRAEPTTEWQFSLQDPWKRRLFFALCRQRGIEPFRFYRQRYSTVMIRATRTVVDNDLWPTYLALSAQLDEYLSDVTLQVIRDVLHQKDAEATELPEGRLLPSQDDE
jgi:hypothetical protein